MSDFLSHLVSSALGTGHPVQPMLAPQAPRPEVVPAPELPPPPLAPPPAPRSELAPPRAPRPAPRARGASASVSVPASIPDPLPSLQRADSGLSVRNSGPFVEDEQSPPPAAAEAEEGVATPPVRPVAPRHVPLAASPVAWERRAAVDGDADLEQAGNRAPVNAASQPSREQEDRLEGAPDHANGQSEGRTAPVQSANRQNEGRTAPLQSANGQSEGRTAPVQSANGQSEGRTAPLQSANEPFEGSNSPSDPAGRRQVEVPLRAPASAGEPPRRIGQAQERRHFEREAPAPSAPPPVQIRIGRVEVRAVRPSQPSAPAKAPASAPAPVAPTPSLTDYLRKQRGRS
jgi:hypothetical protein